MCGDPLGSRTHRGSSHQAHASLAVTRASTVTPGLDGRGSRLRLSVRTPQRDPPAGSCDTKRLQNRDTVKKAAFHICFGGQRGCSIQLTHTGIHPQSQMEVIYRMAHLVTATKAFNFATPCNHFLLQECRPCKNGTQRGPPRGLMVGEVILTSFDDIKISRKMLILGLQRSNFRLRRM